MSKIHHIYRFIIKKQLWFIGGTGLIVAGLLFTSFSGNGEVETIALTRQDLVRTVKISGKVAPSEKVDLAFEISGIVSSVGKTVGSRVYKGETLARLSSGAVQADVQKAEAELSSAMAELNKLEGTAVYENSITNAKRSVVQAIKDAYTAASDSIQNKADQLFIDPLSSRPEIAGSFDGYPDLRNSVNAQKVSVNAMLDDWEKSITGITSANYSEVQLKLSKENLGKISSFIADLSRAVNMFEVTSYMTQSTLDSYKADILAARDSLNSASQKFIIAENSLANSLSDVPVQLARVEAAKAQLANFRFQMGKTALYAPISGIVSKQDAKVGQNVSAGTALVTVISPDYKIETYVPEVSIAGIVNGNPAKVTLDAYGPGTSFEAKVLRIDPAETVRDGVSTYKVELMFLGQDERIRSGMTANVEIETLRKPITLTLPERAVVKDGENSFVFILENGKQRKVEVMVGERDSKGNIELLSGIKEDAQVVVNPSK